MSDREPKKKQHKHIRYIGRIPSYVGKVNSIFTYLPAIECYGLKIGAIETTICLRPDEKLLPKVRSMLKMWAGSHSPP